MWSTGSLRLVVSPEMCQNKSCLEHTLTISSNEFSMKLLKSHWSKVDPNLRRWWRLLVIVEASVWHSTLGSVQRFTLQAIRKTYILLYHALLCFFTLFHAFSCFSVKAREKYNKSNPPYFSECLGIWLKK